MTYAFKPLPPALLACCVLLAACATDSPADDGATEVITEEVTEVVTEEETVVATPPPEDGTDDDDDGADTDGDDVAQEQPFPADTARDRGQAAPPPLTLTDVRVGTHEGYDRVTFEFKGDGTPGWIVEYTDDPTLQGSGRPVDVEGEVVLGSSIRPVEPLTGYDGPERINAPRLEVIEEVVLGTTFESDLGAYIGVSEQVPFRARRFQDPPRVVIDIVHPSAAG